jgi:hypothetical protein
VQSSTFVNTSATCAGFCFSAGAVFIRSCEDCAVVDVLFRNSSVVAAVNDTLSTQCSKLPSSLAHYYQRGGWSTAAAGSALAFSYFATPMLISRVTIVQFSAVSCGFISGGAISIISTSTTRRLGFQVHVTHRHCCFL